MIHGRPNSDKLLLDPNIRNGTLCVSMLFDIGGQNAAYMKGLGLNMKG